MQNNQFLLYRANGYTGRLIAKMAAAYNLTPVLAGRNEAALKQIAATELKTTARLSGPDGYTLTANSSLIITAKIISGNFKIGYQTPAACYGADLVLEIPGVYRESL
ncbi:MAG: hypothetical protein I8H66_03610 [Sphingobacteriia bacterium]|nr:hypothetical protein [Sphingobacteriia bacterium]